MPRRVAFTRENGLVVGGAKDELELTVGGLCDEERGFGHELDFLGKNVMGATLLRIGPYPCRFKRAISARVSGPRRNDSAQRGWYRTVPTSERMLRSKNQRSLSDLMRLRSASGLSVPVPAFCAKPSTTRLRSASVCKRPTHQRPALLSAR